LVWDVDGPNFDPGEQRGDELVERGLRWRGDLVRGLDQVCSGIPRALYG